MLESPIILNIKGFSLNNSILETLKKHIEENDLESALQNTEATKAKLTKTQIHNFGENMKGINEFIGAAQALSLNLSKIRNLNDKIEYIDELLSENKEQSFVLKTQRNAHITNIKYIISNATFLGVELFDTNLSCVVSGNIFSLNIANPINYIENNLSIYCNEKIEEISKLLSNLNNALNAKEQNVESKELSNEMDYSDIALTFKNLYN